MSLNFCGYGIKTKFRIQFVLRSVRLTTLILAMSWMGGNTLGQVAENVLPRLTAKKLEIGELPNAILVCEGVVSGGLPSDEDAFAKLKELGIKTIISVDGAKPDLEAAEKFGLRYVHMPHGYDGVSEERGLELAKALLELPGPVYIHCHHGFHRSPAASVVAAVGAGKLAPEIGVAMLEFAGTGPNYRGLYQSAREARAFTAAELAEVASEFPAVVEVPPMAEAMVDLELVFDRLRNFRVNDWKSPTNHPDLKLAHEALILREHYTELLRLQDQEQYSTEFWQDMRKSLELAEDFERATQAESPMAGKLNAAFLKVEQDCKLCHRTHRDIPLKEKKIGDLSYNRTRNSIQNASPKK